LQASYYNGFNPIFNEFYRVNVTESPIKVKTEFR